MEIAKKIGAERYLEASAQSNQVTDALVKIIEVALPGWPIGDVL
jgi:hypothetical protein